MPRPGELMGIVVSLSGGSRMVVQCEDGKERIARIPGKIRNKIWVREGDYVLLVPWSVEGDKKCDIVFRYTSVQSDILKQKGVIRM
jgi:translation initiation factor 1A